MRKNLSILAVLVAGFATNALAAPKLRLSATTVGPVLVPLNGTASNVPSVNAANVGDSTLNLTATTNASAASWLSAKVGSAQGCSLSQQCYPVTFTLNTSTLAAGTYTGIVTLSDPNAADSPQTVTVTAQVGTSVPDNLTLFAAPGGSQATAAFDTRGTMNSSVNGLPFVTVSLQGNGSLFNPSTQYQSQVSVNPAGVAAGTYTGTIVTSGSASATDNKTVHVTVNVTTSPIAQATLPDNGICQMIAPENTQKLSGTVYCHAPAGGPSLTQYIAINNLGQGSLTISGASASSGVSGWLAAQPLAGYQLVQMTLNPSALTAGSYQGTITVNTNAANSPQTIPVQLDVVAPAAGPLARVNGATNDATFAAGEPVAPGDIIALFGEQLLPGSPVANTSTTGLPTTLGDVKVLVNGTPAPLYYVSYNQINFQVPYETALGDASIQVVQGSKTGNTISVQVVKSAPRILVLSIPGNYGIIVNGDGSFPVPSSVTIPGYKTHPAKAGDVLVMYAIGLGQTSPTATTGAAVPGNPLEHVPGNSQVLFGGGFGASASSTPAFVGLTPFFVGLYQVNVAVPGGTPKGDSVPVTLYTGGAASNIVNIAIQ